MSSQMSAVHTPAKEALRSATTIVWTVALIAAVPWALVTFFGWPLPRQFPDWSEVVSTPIQLIDPTVILNFFVCMAWAAWAVVIAYLVVDIGDVARGLGQRLHRFGPLSGLAAKLVAAVVLLITLARQPATSAAPYRPVPITYVAELPTTEPPVPPSTLPEASLPATAAQAIELDPTYSVCRGDSLWSIAEAHLGSGFRWQEIHDLNRDQIADPDYIEIDQVLVLPADAVGIELPVVPEAEAAPFPLDAPVIAPQPTPAPPSTPAPDNAPSPTSTASPRSSVVPSAPNSSDRPAAPEADPTESSSDWGVTGFASPVPAVPGIAGATALSSGLLVALLRSRRRTSALGNHRRKGRDLERAIVAAADIPLVRWAGQELASLASSISDRHFDAGPVAVEFSAETGLEILWDRPVWSRAPRPWEAVPGGWGWRCLYDAEAPVPDADLPSPIAGLVTFGQREGKQLLVDLDSLGSLSITGDPVRAENFVRSLVLELGANDDLSDAYVFAVEGALDIDGAEHLDRVQPAALDDVYDRLASVAGSDGEDSDGAALSGFARRVHGDDLASLEVYVAVARSSPDIASLIQVATARSGSVAIVLGDAPAAATLAIDASGSARLEPLGLSFDAAGVGRDLAAQVAVLLDDTAEQPSIADVGSGIEPSERVEVDPATADGGGTLELEDEPPTPDLLSLIDLTGGPGEDLDEWTLPPVRLLVRVLGIPAIRDRPRLGRRELMVVVYAACSPRPVTPAEIQDAIWGGDAVSQKTVSNLIGHTRTALGDWDQQPILSRVSSGTMQLAEGVYSDHRLFEILTDRAAQVPSSRAAPLLHQALDLIDGPPFNADGYEWAHVSQLVAEIEARVERATLDLVNLELQAGDIEEARRAVTQGLRALPGNEVLYRERIRIEETAGNTKAARSALKELIHYLEDLGTEPSTHTLARFGHLVGE